MYVPTSTDDNSLHAMSWYEHLAVSHASRVCNGCVRQCARTHARTHTHTNCLLQTRTTAATIMHDMMKIWERTFVVTTHQRTWVGTMTSVFPPVNRWVWWVIIIPGGSDVISDVIGAGCCCVRRLLAATAMSYVGRLGAAAAGRDTGCCTLTSSRRVIIGAPSRSRTEPWLTPAALLLSAVLTAPPAAASNCWSTADELRLPLYATQTQTYTQTHWQLSLHFSHVDTVDTKFSS